MTANTRKAADSINLSNVLQTRSVIGKNNPLLPPSFNRMSQT